jgi:ribosomal protein L9
MINHEYIKELDTKKWLQLDKKIFEIIEIINTGELNIELKLYCKIR